MKGEPELSLVCPNFVSELDPRPGSSSPNKINVHFNYRKAVSLERSNQIRQQSFTLKRYKPNKLAHEAKQVPLGNCDDWGFKKDNKQIEWKTSYPLNSAKMMPPANNTWVNNSKRVQMKNSASKRGSSEQAMIRMKPQPLEDYNDQLAHDLKDYLQTVKSFFIQHKRKVEKQRKMKVSINNQIRFNLEQDGNLNIVKLKPSTNHQVRRRQTLECQKQASPPMSPKPNFKSTEFMETNSPAHSQPDRLFVRTASTNRGSERIFRKKMTAKKIDYHNIFGQFKQFMTQEQIQKLKQLYYYDFLWKVAFNRGFFTQPMTEIYKYYIGKGNNSRLIRKIMAKRPWWVEDSKQENAHFIWTQLKIYDVYKNQRCEKEPKKLKNEALEQLQQMQQYGFLTTSQFFPQKSQILSPVQVIEDKNRYILNQVQYKKWRTYISSRGGVEKKAYEDMHQRFIEKVPTRRINHKITNHLQFSRVIGNKKALYRTMQAYLNFKGTQEQYLPLTFHITGGIQNEQYLAFLREYYKLNKEGFSWWIVKPGELSNRGKDIKYCNTLQMIKQQIKKRKVNPNGSLRTYLVQSYIDKPLLYQGRKFDLRHYFLMTSTEGVIRGYFYQDGYVRTTSTPYSLNHCQPGVHLTNDAVQKFLPTYGKYQKANKLSYQQLHDYMIKRNPKDNFYTTVYPQIKQITIDIICAAYPFIDPQRRANNFEIFGIDIMIDDNLKCWLIEVNTNPCIEVNCKVLANIVPQMLDNSLVIGLDSLVNPTTGKNYKLQHNNYLAENKFELVFDQQIHGASLQQYRSQNMGMGDYGDDDDNYESGQEDDYDY